MEERIDYGGQTKIFNPENQHLNIKIIGVGSGGSWITLLLAKMGVKNIEVWDFDKICMHNIPNQLYEVDSIEKSKVDLRD